MFNKNDFRDDNNRRYVISLTHPQDIIAEQYRKLRTNLEQIRLPQSLKTIGITSTFMDEGKTTAALNLAVVYAQSQLKTLLVEADLRRPSIASAFNLKNAQGLKHYDNEEVDIKNLIHSIGPSLDVIVAGSVNQFASEFFMSQKFKSLLTQLKTQYERIIFDCPPISAVADTLTLAQEIDGFVYAVASNKTLKKAFEHAYQNLSDAGATMLGVVLTQVKTKHLGYQNYYYQAYKTTKKIS
jgi:capsular exopolysaccharide synthesis family protein